MLKIEIKVKIIKNLHKKLEKLKLIHSESQFEV